MATDLITKLEEAGEGSRELAGAVWYAVHEPDVDHGCLHVEQTEQGPIEVLTCELGSKYADCVGHYTTSLDAALALAERVIERRGPIGIDVSPDGSAQVVIDNADPFSPPISHGSSSTPALALCAAILRASEEKQS